MSSACPDHQLVEEQESNTWSFVNGCSRICCTIVCSTASSWSRNVMKELLHEECSSVTVINRTVKLQFPCPRICKEMSYLSTPNRKDASDIITKWFNHEQHEVTSSVGTAVLNRPLTRKLSTSNPGLQYCRFCFNIQLKIQLIL